MANPHPEPHPENLIPCKPGEVRNPNGSSKKQRLTSLLVRMLDEAGEKGEREFMEAGLQAAKAADFNFWKYIYERIDGKLPEPEPDRGRDEELAEKLRQIRKNRKDKNAEGG